MTVVHCVICSKKKNKKEKPKEKPKEPKAGM